MLRQGKKRIQPRIPIGRNQNRLVSQLGSDSRPNLFCGASPLVSGCQLNPKRPVPGNHIAYKRLFGWIARRQWWRQAFFSAVGLGWIPWTVFVIAPAACNQGPAWTSLTSGAAHTFWLVGPQWVRQIKRTGRSSCRWMECFIGMYRKCCITWTANESKQRSNKISVFEASWG